MQIRNEPLAMEPWVVKEGIYVLTSANIEAITADLTLFFQKLWIYPAKSVGTAGTLGILTPNTNAINLGKSGTTANPLVQYLPDVLNTTDGPIAYELPLGQKMALAQIIVKGTAGDGVYFQFT